MENNAVTFPTNAQTRFYLCRSCNNHVLCGHDIIDVATSGDTVQIYSRNPVNVRYEPSIAPLFYRFLPCGRSWGLGQSNFSCHSYPVTSTTVHCNVCNRYLGRRQIFQPVISPRSSLTLIPRRRRTMLSLDQLLFWNGTQMVYADTEQPVDQNPPVVENGHMD